MGLLDADEPKKKPGPHVKMPISGPLDKAIKAGAEIVMPTAAAIATGGAGYPWLSPFAGAAVRLLGMFVKAPIERQRDEWANDIYDDLQTLKATRNLRLEDLQDNQAFVEALCTALPMAMFTGLREKRRALRNAVLNSALSVSLSAIEQQMFFGMIDRFTELHLLALSVLKDPSLSLSKLPATSVSPRGLDPRQSTLRTVLQVALADHLQDDWMADQVWADLRAANLVEGAPSLDNWGEGPSVTKKRTTPFGDRFVEFITSPLPD